MGRRKLADASEPPALRPNLRQPETLPGSPSRKCGNCEHFDGGGVDKEGRPIERYGVCRNGISGRLQTTIDHGCGHGFYPCTVRWPLRAGPGGIYREGT